MSYAEERLAEIRAAKALSKSKRPISKLAHKIRSRIKVWRRLEALRRQGGLTFVDHDDDDALRKDRASYEKGKQEWRIILERHIRKPLAKR